MTAASRNQLRIIGGAWRGRKLAFPPLESLRPTPDRVRETLFNWLRDVVPGAHCLDLFAGSGALSFEALSRGAASAVLVDQHLQIVEQLRQHVETLKVTNAHVVQADAFGFLRQPPLRPHDLVFLDPPFHAHALEKCIELLAAPGWLAPGAWIYIEAARGTPLPALPESWRLMHAKHAGQVGYHLIQCVRATMEPERTAP